MLLTFFHVICIALFLCPSYGNQRMQHLNGHAPDTISNYSLVGMSSGCKHQSQYFITNNVQFQMCMGQTDQDLKNGMSIINLINSRGYLPTCRILHLMLWMASTVHEKGFLSRDYFVDVGANIGSCSVHMAALGFPVISVEPVPQHVDTIQGSININPSFHIELHHVGLSSVEKVIQVNFGHGARNWGASEFHEVGKNETFETELKLKTLDHLVGSRRVSLLKVDCEGCEWETLKSAKRVLRRIPMIKMELVQPTYTAGNETVTAYDIIGFLNRSHYEIFIDHWNEQHLYFGKHGDKILEIDRLLGSAKFKVGADEIALNEAAKLILSNPLDPHTFDQRNFLKRATDIIAIDKVLAQKMKAKWLVST